MADEVMVSVGYEGKQYRIPAEIARLNATQPGVAKAWIEEQIAEETDRRQQAKQRKEESVEAEFENISAKLSKVDGIERAMAAMQQSVDAYASANAALNAQVAALEESGGVLGGANSSARQTAFELATQSTAGGAILSQMQSTQLSMERQLDSFQQQLDDFQLAIAKQVTEALAAGQSRQRLEQEASNRLLDDVGRAEERAAKAEGLAAQALSDAKAAQSLNKNDVTRGQITSMVTAEVIQQAPILIDKQIREDRDLGVINPGGPTMDRGFMAQRQKDSNALTEHMYGRDSDWKRTAKGRS